jgi:hypothetical protein
MSTRFAYEVTQPATTDPSAWPRLGRLRGAWYRIRFTIQEMNYAALRVGAPWCVDTQWHSK